MNDLTKLLKMKENGVTIDILTSIMNIYLEQKAIALAKETLEEIDCFASKSCYYYFSGALYETTKDYLKAIHYYDLAFKEDASCLEALYDKARMLDKIKNTKEAIEIYEYLLDSDFVNLASVFVNLSSIYELSGNYNSAIEVLDLAFEKNIVNQDILYNMAVSYMRLFEYEKAIYYYLDAIDYTNCNKYAYFNLGFCYKCLKDYQEALSFYNQALEKSVPKEMVYYNIACVYALEKKSTSAIDLLNRCFKIDSTYLDYALDDEELINDLVIKKFLENY